MRVVGSTLLFCLAVFLLLSQYGCAGAASSPAAANPSNSVGAAQLVGLSPSAVEAGHASFLLTVKGMNFSDQSVISWNGTSQPTSFVSAEVLTTQIPAQSTAAAAVVPVAIQDKQSGKVTNSLTFTVGNPPKITTTALPAGQTGVAYSAPIAVSGGIAPFQWSAESGNMPAGLALNSQTGIISGTAEDPGDSSVKVLVTDSLSSTATTDLSIKIAASAQTSAPGTAGSSTASSYYGSGIGSDGLANTTVGPLGNVVSYRFRAKNSGVVHQALIYLIPDHPGYAGGNAGTTLITLNTDDGTPSHNPSSKVLASYVMENVLSLAKPARNFYTFKFATPPTLTAGQIYHMVFKSIDASPNVNFLSVDALYELNFSSPVQGAISSTDAAVLLGNAAGGWAPRPGYTPIYQLTFENGVTEGIGYMEGWIGAPMPISGTNAVREAFTVSGSDVKVSSVAIRVARVLGNDPLVVRLENADGTLIEEGSIPATAIPLSSLLLPSYFWAKYTLSSTDTLLAGSTYHLDLEASSTSIYQGFPIRKGLAYGFQSTTYFPDGDAAFEKGGTWTGWTQWGVANRTDGDLQFYFSVVP